MSYLTIYEKTATGWGAYVPDLPGLGVVGSTLAEVKETDNRLTELAESAINTAAQSPG